MTSGTRFPPDKPTPATNATLWTLPTCKTNDWAESPPILPTGTKNTERYARRAANHEAFKINGNKDDWLHYVIFGFYLYDDVTTFVIEWRDAKKTKLQLSYFIWNSYHQYRMKSLTMVNDLALWAVTHAKPFLQTHDPDVILATTLDFENFEISSTVDQRDEPEEAVWTEIGKPGKKNLTSIHPLQTPPPSPKSRTNSLNKEHTPTKTYYSPIQVDDCEDEEDIPSSQVFSHTKDNDDTTMNDAVHNATPNTSPIPQTALTPLTTNTTTTQQPENPYTKKAGKKATGIFSFKKRLHMKTATQNQTENNIDSPPQTKTRNPQTPNNTDPSTTQTTSKTPKVPSTQTSTKPTGSFDDQTQISSQSTFQTSNPHIPINDGTQRLTMRWKPENFDQLDPDTNIWNNQTVAMLHELFHVFAEKINAVIWEDKRTESISVESIHSGNLRQYLSPKISTLTTAETFIFGVRVSAGANTVGNWLTDEHTREMMKSLNVEATISNAKCTSGNVVTAGCILFKHPIYTHRLYYLLSLRKKLPENTPFFDIGIHRRTSNGAEIPHLVIKCGENHIQGLTDILASHMDGKTTSAIFVPQPAIQSMTEEELMAMFHAHHNVVTKMQRLSLHPRVVNVDRTRSEKYSGEEVIHRTTREWANSLKTPEGQHMRCDAENGGSDRRANILVPEEYIEHAKEELHKYLCALKAGLYVNTQSRDSNTNQNDTPRAIYIPSQAVRANLDFLKSFTTPAELWQNAPISVRQTSKAAALSKSHQRLPSRQQHQSDQPKSPDQGQSLQTKGTPGSSGMPTNPKPTFNTTTQQPDQPNEQPRADDDTIETLASTTSRTTAFFSAQTTRFQELEAQIKQNNRAYAEANSKIDTIQEQVIKTMEACAASSQQINEMRHKLNECASAQQVTALTLQVQELANAMTALFKLQPLHNHQQESHQHTHHMNSGGKPIDSERATDHADKQNPKRPLNHDSINNTINSGEKQPSRSPSNNKEIVDEPIVSTTATAGNLAGTTLITSPEKKKTKIHLPSLEEKEYAQEPSAQYTTECTPDDPEI